MNHMKFESPDLTAQNIDRIAALFPNCITEMLDEEHSTPEKKVYKRAVNFELLKQMLSPDVVDGDEAYEFTWVGKKAAIVEANKPIRKTLRPCVAESKDWDNTENLYIEGDNLEVLKLLQESYLGKVKMIYIDPPYNTGNDFIYADDFMRSQEEENAQMGMYDEDKNRLFKNTDTNGRFHSDWCSMIYSRLMLARNLLMEDGVIFISIDDNELSSLIDIGKEIFGFDNYVATFVWEKRKTRENRKIVSVRHDYIICFTKTFEQRSNAIGLEEMNDEAIDRYKNPDNDPRGYGHLYLPLHKVDTQQNPNFIRLYHQRGCLLILLLDHVGVIRKNACNKQLKIIEYGLALMAQEFRESKSFCLKESKGLLRRLFSLQKMLVQMIPQSEN